MATAVLSGDHTLELRVFTTHSIPTAREIQLTAALCRQMNKSHLQWSRQVPYQSILISTEYHQQ